MLRSWWILTGRVFLTVTPFGVDPEEFYLHVNLEISVIHSPYSFKNFRRESVRRWCQCDLNGTCPRAMGCGRKVFNQRLFVVGHANIVTPLPVHLPLIESEASSRLE